VLEGGEGGPAKKDHAGPLHRLYTAAYGLDTVYTGTALSCGQRDSYPVPDWRVQMDIVFIGAMIAFFVLSIGLIRFCERLSDGERR
jgi:hypothetical protein